MYVIFFNSRGFKDFIYICDIGYHMVMKLTMRMKKTKTKRKTNREQYEWHSQTIAWHEFLSRAVC